ncbi:TolC family protein [bacterium]|nr:TolC family protein [bacterium]
MLKKAVLILSIMFVGQSVFAIDRAELNPEFFNRFNDECLYFYINEAIENNHSAKQATYRVEQYRQQVKYSFSKELPSFNIAANYLGVHVPQLDNFELQKNAFILPFIANYEADFLLKNRDKTKSEKKSYEASKFEEKAVYLSLLSDVATVYTNILAYDELIGLAQEKVAIYSEILKRDNKKFKRGTISTSQLNTSEKNLETSKNELENLQKEQEILLMQLAVLTGKSADYTQDLRRGKFETIEYQKKIPDEIESDVIFSRPDVMQAEKMLEKAKIDIRVARKEFLPRFNITGLWIFNTIAPGTFFSWESSLAAILAGASQDIFTGGRKIANLKIQKAKYEELFEKYRQTDLDAVKEVNTALCLIKHDTKVDKNTLSKVQYEYRNLENSRKKYARGTISTPEYLNDLSKFIDVQKEAIQTKNQRLVNYFTLYKAVGGKL